ncbi:MAG: ABC transporter permease [Lachnospiraceae bacterium]|nr:ABC transporter permease [Lachnospiraceae bacterium]
MKNILMLMTANIRKGKSQSITLLLFVLIATIMLNAGFVLIFGIGNFFDERAEVNNAPHFAVTYFDGSEGIKEGEQFIKNYPGVIEAEKLNAIGGLGEIFTNETSSPITLLISRMDENQKMDRLSLIGDSLPLTGNAIYMPYYLFINDNYSIGDNLKLSLSNVELNFTIAGATEDIMYGNAMTTVVRFYVSDIMYAELEKQISDNSLTLLSARLKNSADAIYMLADFNRDNSQEDVYSTWMYNFAKQGRTMVPLIAAAVIIAFAAILLVVCLIVIRFRIINSIEESMTNIGTQKAIGYKSVQIILAIVMQFGLITFIGGIFGIILSQIVIPFITSLLEPMIALAWQPKFNPGSALISIVAVLVTVMLISYLTARKINKLHPLIALRGGITTHSFKKNPLPLEKSRASLNFLLAFKQILQNKKQSVTIAIIVALVTMSSIIGIAANFNINEGQENFLRAFFGELPEIAVRIEETKDGEAFKERMSARSGVRKIFGYFSTGGALLIDDVRIYADIVEDCSLMEGNLLIDGRYPRHNNEIALGAAVSMLIGKTTGDTVMVKVDEISRNYIVTGIVQIMSNNGLNGVITDDALREIQPDYISSHYYVYLNDGVDINDFIKEIKIAEDDTICFVINTQEQMFTFLDGMGGIFAAIAIGMIGITAFVVILVLYMVIKTTIMRKRRELGIQKAVGFTTLQLMNQIALNMMPVILTGIISGALAGYFGFNTLMGATLTGFGIVQVDLPIPLGQIIISCITLIILAYAVSMLIAWRIRKITAYSLVSE